MGSASGRLAGGDQGADEADGAADRLRVLRADLAELGHALRRIGGLGEGRLGEAPVDGVGVGGDRRHLGRDRAAQELPPHEVLRLGVGDGGEQPAHLGGRGHAELDQVEQLVAVALVGHLAVGLGAAVDADPAGEAAGLVELARPERAAVGERAPRRVAAVVDGHGAAGAAPPSLAASIARRRGRRTRPAAALSLRPRRAADLARRRGAPARSARRGAGTGAHLALLAARLGGARGGDVQAAAGARAAAGGCRRPRRRYRPRSPPIRRPAGGAGAAVAPAGGSPGPVTPRRPDFVAEAGADLPAAGLGG